MNMNFENNFNLHRYENDMVLRIAESLNVNSMLIKNLKGKIILIKYGGSVSSDPEENNTIIENTCYLKRIGAFPVIVHGGGSEINNLLKMAAVKSEFIEGLRVTSSEAMVYVELALKGKVGSEIVQEISRYGLKAVGISGRDGNMVQSEKKECFIKKNGSTYSVDLGRVGKVENINTDLILTLLKKDYIPVISPIGFGKDFEAYNINADIFAGNLAGALQVNFYIAITDVDGLREDINDPSSLISELSIEQAKNSFGKSINGGMIPKIESCITALKNGVNEAFIVNGKRKNIIIETLLSDNSIGTKITN